MPPRHTPGLTPSARRPGFRCCLNIPPAGCDEPGFDKNNVVTYALAGSHSGYNNFGQTQAVDRGTIDPLDSVPQQYVANPTRYDGIAYERCGVSGLCLPRISLGLWNSFGADRPFKTQRTIVLRAFDNGVTHFDLANNYGPPPGAAEAHFGRIIARDLRPYRDESIVSSKAGYGMWPGHGGSRKHVLASLDQSLARLRLDYLDVFYSHRFDPHTPLEETMGALATAVRSGRARYVGISNYDADQTRRAAAILDDLGIALTVHQPRYNIFDRTP